MLLDRPGELLTREEICRELWPDGTFVDYDHGLNSAVNRIRGALGDKASNPRFLEMLAACYRFVAQQELDRAAEEIVADAGLASVQEKLQPVESLPETEQNASVGLLDRVLATPG